MGAKRTYLTRSGPVSMSITDARWRTLTVMHGETRHALRYLPCLASKRTCVETNLLAASAPAYVVRRPTLMQADAIRQICFLAPRCGARHVD